MVLAERVTITVRCDFPGCTESAEVDGPCKADVAQTMRERGWTFSHHLHGVRCPEHVGTHRQHKMTKPRRDRGMYAERNREIARRLAAGEASYNLARKYGLTISMINFIRRTTQI